MPENFDFKTVEPKWRAEWDRMALFKARENDPRPKCYVLSMYPYPSGVLHMGHVINYTLGDVVARYKMLRGFSVLSPMGWDSFGLPAENAAIRTGVHPRDFTEKNIAHMREQMRRAGWMYDWDRELATSHEDYYRWTQWLFLQFHKRGLAVKKTAPVNWCESCATVLANEQVKDGLCERCGSEVENRDMNQWFFRMSAYAEQLLDGLDELRGKWPDSVVAMQEEWIGRSEGALVHFTVKETGDPVDVFTTRPDTLWGVTFLSLAPEHPLVEKLLAKAPDGAEKLAAVKRLRAGGTSEKELAGREKEGVFTGFHVVNPVNGEAAPLWVANFALMTYGTGAVMGVPAHDQRDFEFAKKYGLPIRVVIAPPAPEHQPRPVPPPPHPAHIWPDAVKDWMHAFTTVGTMVDSGPFSGRPNNFALIPEINQWLADKGYGERRTQYRLRDWLLSRQRYWGAPIPVVHCGACGAVPVPEADLPVRLPTDIDFRAGRGNPLARSDSFVNCPCPRCGKPAKRETDTMDTFVDSSWYFARFCDARNGAAVFDPGAAGHWLPVDQYIGGIEHATMHLIYARFFNRVMHEMGLVPTAEPFTRLFCQGMVCKTAYRCPEHKWLAADQLDPVEGAPGAEPAFACKRCGAPAAAEMHKISKSKLNVVDPDEMFDRYGADTVRLYMLSDAPPDRMTIWSEQGINGAWRTLNRLWNLVLDNLSRVAPPGRDMPAAPGDADRALRRKTHQCVDRVTAAIEDGFQFNTAIARCNELLNQLRAARGVDGCVLRETLETIVRVLSPIVPHFAEECWRRLGHGQSVFLQPWPAPDAEAMREEAVEIPVRINGKVRARVRAPAGLPAGALGDLALADPKVRELLAGGTVGKLVPVPDRIVDIIIKK